MRHDSYGYHVSRWPPPWLRDRRRVPAILVQREGSWVIVDPSGETWIVACHEDVLKVANQPYDDPKVRLDIFVPKIGHYPFLTEALALLGRGTTAPASARGASQLCCRYRRATIKVGESTAWGYDQVDATFLRNLSLLYAHLGEGAEVTPGALGAHTMHARFTEAGHKAQSRPNWMLREDLLTHRVGARSDPPISNQTFDRVYELDLHDAYAWAASCPLPNGPIERILDGDVVLHRVSGDPDATGPYRAHRGDQMRESRRGDGFPRDAENRDRPRQGSGSEVVYRTWYCRCTIFIPLTLRNSPICTKDTTGHVRALKAKGTHEVWCWREEAEAMAHTGAVVLVHEGWGWFHLDPILKEWAEWMHAKRRDAPTPAVADLVKRCITAGIGRQGMAPETRRLAWAKDAPDGSLLLDASPGSEPLCVVVERDHDAPWLTHVHDFIVMLVRLWQYQRQAEEDADGNTILASNTDAIYVLAPSRRSVDPVLLGGVRQRERLNWRSPYARAAVWDGGKRLPGLHGKERERYG